MSIWLAPKTPAKRDRLCDRRPDRTTTRYLAVRLEMAAVYLRLAGDSKAVQLLSGAIRTYRMGSPRPRSPSSPAGRRRLGIGGRVGWAHPGDPARLEGPDGGFAARRHRRRPRTASWAGVVCRRFGGTLPFLVKVLAADEPLSLQGSSECRAGGGGLRARTGRRAGQLPVRNYRDRSHKPGTSGGAYRVPGRWRIPAAARSVALMCALEVAALDPYIALLTDQSDAAGLRALFTT